MVSKLPANLPFHSTLKFVNSYLNSGDLRTARKLFDKIPEPDLRAWTLFISAHTHHGFQREAIELYSALISRNIRPDKFLLLSVAKACASSGNLSKAKEIHHDAIKYGFVSDTLLGNALVNMYDKCRSIDGARSVFNDILVKDVVSWTSMASCYVHCGLFKQALVTFREMARDGVKVKVKANAMTVSSVLPACVELKDLRSGKEIHGFVLRNGFINNVFVSSGLVNMYASCLSLKHARLVFETMSRRDTVSWNVVLTAYFVNKEFEKGIDLFYRMKRENVELHHSSWNTVVAGCIQNEQYELGLRIVVEMQKDGFKPNQITITSILPGCSAIENLRGGKEIHCYMYRHGFITDLTATTALCFLYAKCGDVDRSMTVFNSIRHKDTVAWNTAIIANSMHGKGEDALLLFREMLGLGVKPNSVTFTAVLSGCSHARLVDEAGLIFESMSKVHLVNPDVDHYSCMVDVLSRAGRLNEAYEFIQTMPAEPTPGAWGALLGACRVYKNVELGRIAAYRLFEIEPDNPGNYVLLSNILVTAKLWSEASETRKAMRDIGIVKKPGCSWIHVRNKVYTFVVGDKSNEQSGRIYEFLDDMVEKMRLVGYKPNTEFVLQDVDQEEEKEGIVCNHSEKLAVAFGLLNMNGESSIRVFKNLRICGDCHNGIKLMAKIVGVEIVVRDSLRFHHFKDGYCSCHDFW